MDSWRHLIDTPQLLALAAALGWASGVRLYAAVFLVGMAGYMGWIDLPTGLKVLQHPGVLAASGFMAFTFLMVRQPPCSALVSYTALSLSGTPRWAALAAAA